MNFRTAGPLPGPVTILVGAVDLYLTLLLIGQTSSRGDPASVRVPALVVPVRSLDPRKLMAYAGTPAGIPRRRLAGPVERREEI